MVHPFQNNDLKSTHPPLVNRLQLPLTTSGVGITLSFCLHTTVYLAIILSWNQSGAFIFLRVQKHYQVYSCISYMYITTQLEACTCVHFFMPHHGVLKELSALPWDIGIFSKRKTNAWGRRDGHACNWLSHNIIKGESAFIHAPMSRKEPISPIKALGVNPFPSRFYNKFDRMVPRGGFARQRWKETITTK